MKNSVLVCLQHRVFFFFFSSRRRHTRCSRDWSSDVCSSDLEIHLRRQQVDFSTVYYDAGQRVLVPTSSSARGLQDLGGKRVCASAQSAPIPVRSEERRVGKECRSRWSPYH